MNIQAADILSLFPGVDSLDSLQQTLATDGVLPESFANALMAEIQQLQAALQQHPAGENIAAINVDIQPLDGNLLPADGNIDLEQTFQTLDDIISRLKILGLEEKKDQPIMAEAGQILSLAEKPLPPPEKSREIHPADSEETDDPVALALAAIQQTINTQNTEMEVVADSQKPFDIEAMTKGLTSLSERGAANQQADKTAGLISTVMNEGETTAEDGQPEQSFNKNNPVFLEAGQKDQPDNDNMLESESPVSAASKNGAKTMEAAQNMMDLNRAVSSLPQSRPVSATVQPAVGHPQWGTEMADKIVWMAQKQIPSAEIHLNPRHLGPVSVQIDVEKDQTRIAFHANNLLVKDSIEAALPRLKEMLASQQLNLVEVNVSQQQSDQKQSSQAFFQQHKDDNSRQDQADPQKETLADSAAAVIDEIESGRAIVSQGVLSLFA